MIWVGSLSANHLYADKLFAGSGTRESLNNEYRLICANHQQAIDDRKDLDQDAIDPLEAINARLEHSRKPSALRQPLGWLLGSGEIEQILVGRLPWSDKEHDPPASHGIRSRQSDRPTADKINNKGPPQEERDLVSQAPITSDQRWLMLVDLLANAH